MYTDVQRKADFDYFVENYERFYLQYGHSFIAIKNKEVLGNYTSVREALDSLSPKYEVGSYIIQECTGDDSAYRTTIMRLVIKG